VTDRIYLLDGETISRPALRQALGTNGLANIFTSMLNHRPLSANCPHCGSTQAEIGATGLAGCPLCYAVHETYLVERFGIADA
jgi:protein-arginine kinase activator protein McsA